MALWQVRPSLLLVLLLAPTLLLPACSQFLLSRQDFAPDGCPDPPGGIATFRPMVEELEAREAPPHFTGLPRGVHQKTYAGTSVWNSRGMNLTQAVRAMLGDPFAYYESALFTVYKMVLLNQSASLPDLVYDWDRGHWPTTEDGPWPQYKVSPPPCPTTCEASNPKLLNVHGILI